MEMRIVKAMASVSVTAVVVVLSAVPARATSTRPCFMNQPHLVIYTVIFSVGYSLFFPKIPITNNTTSRRSFIIQINEHLYILSLFYLLCVVATTKTAMS